jgi:hypothetical protein
VLGFYHYAIWPKRHNVWSTTKHPSYYICSISDTPGEYNLASGAFIISRKMKIYPWDLDSTFLTEYRLAPGTHWLDLGPDALLGPLLLDPRVNILLSEVAERSHKTPSPDLRTKLRHSTTPRRISHSPGTALEVPGIGEAAVRDIHEAYGTDGDMIYAGPTWCIWVPLNARKLPFFCFLALRLVSRVNYSCS